MNLKKYQDKRDFTKTAEPAGKVEKTGKSRFVVQDHHARSHHYDFRLEMEGVLRSWAVPKGVPEQAGVKRLAVMVEDHPVDYIDFEGDIPEGEYGAGTVKIFDRGNWSPVGGSLQEGSIKFNLAGKKLRGDYALVKLPDGNNWLIYKISE